MTSITLLLIRIMCSCRIMEQHWRLLGKCITSIARMPKSLTPTPNVCLRKSFEPTSKSLRMGRLANVDIRDLRLIFLRRKRKKKVMKKDAGMRLFWYRGRNPSSMNYAPTARLNTQLQQKLQEKHGTKSSPGSKTLTHRNFIMSRFQKII